LWLGAALAGGLVTVLVVSLSSQSPGTALSFGLMAASTALFMGHQSVAAADLEARKVGRSDLVRGVALPLATAAAVGLGGLDVATAALAHAVAMIASVMVLPAITTGRVDPPVWAELRPLARYGVPIGIWSVVALGNAQLGRAALEIAGDPEALGLFAGIQDVVVKCGTLLLMPIVSAIHGHAMALWAQGDRTSLRTGLRRAFKLQIGVGVVVVLGALVGGGALARLLFGADVPAGSPTAITALLALGVVLANIGLVAHKGLELVHATAVMVACAVAALAFDALACALVVPSWGAVGAAAAFAASQLVYALLALACSRRALSLRSDAVPNRAASRSGRTGMATL
jgi:O-antigen/teichoic acid export membrane protein